MLGEHPHEAPRREPPVRVPCAKRAGPAIEECGEDFLRQVVELLPKLSIPAPLRSRQTARGTSFDLRLEQRDKGSESLAVTFERSIERQHHHPPL